MALRALQGPAGGPPVGGSGNINTIPRWTGATTLGDSGLIDNGTTVYATSRNLAVGTSSPSCKFHVSQADSSVGILFNGTTKGIRVGFASGTSTIDGVDHTGTSYQPLQLNGSTVTLAYGGTAALTVNASGNVGIGLTGPQTRAEINYGTLTAVSPSTPNTTTALMLSANDPGATAAGNGVLMQMRPITNRGATVAIGAVNSSTNKDGDGCLTFYRNAGSYLVSEAMRIDAAGNVGVGTASPASRLDVAGTITCDDAGTGLKLPATPGNADTQTLDAYQEIGTGTPAEIALGLTCGTSGTITVNAASSKARVTRVGNKVIGHARILVSSVAAPVGRLSCTLTGCPQPFTNFLCETRTDSTTGLASGNLIVGTSDTGAPPTIYFDRYSPNTSNLDAAANIQAGTIILFNFVYSV